MTDRKKRAIGFLVTGAVFLIAGVATWSSDASWLPTVLGIVGAVAGVVGISVTLPSL